MRPTLEYASCAWAPHTKTGNQIMEGVQRSAARFVTCDYRSRSSVGAVCTNLVWNSLYTRRRIRYATMFFKIPHGLMRISLTVVITTADARTIHQHKHNPQTLSATSFYVRCIIDGPTVNVNEDMTRRREALAKKTRQLKKSRKINEYWTFNRKGIAKTIGGVVKEIRSDVDLTGY